MFVCFFIFNFHLKGIYFFCFFVKKVSATDKIKAPTIIDQWMKMMIQQFAKTIVNDAHALKHDQQLNVYNNIHENICEIEL